MSAHRLAIRRPTLMLVSDRALCVDQAITETILEAVGDSVNVVQLREKDLPASEILDLATRLRSSLPAGVLLVINDRMDVAQAARADGVQLGAGSIPVRVARDVAPDLLIGASVHAVDEAVQAERDGADYLVVGTMFQTRSHPGKTPEGLALMRSIRETVALPLLGIGGITVGNAASVMDAGADGVAVISEILAAVDPARAAGRLWRALQ